MSRTWVAGLAALCACATANKGPSEADELTDLPGTAVVFEASADTTDPAAFFDQPWPLDTRRTADGHPDYAGLPVGDTPSATQLLSLLEAARDFSQVPTVVFRFDGPLSSRGLADGPAALSAAFFVDVDPSSPGFGAVVPAFVGTPPADVYTPDHALVLQPVHGFVLSPATVWAAVVTREVVDEAGVELGVPAEVRAGLRGAGELARALAPLADAVAAGALVVNVDDIAAATVFSTDDVVADTRALTDAVRAEVVPVLEGFEVAPGDGASHPRFCEVHATIDLPQYQRGEPPFDADGTFVWDGTSLPPVQRTETVPVVLTLPLDEMPADGWPVVVYAHGSGGAFDQVVDRGPILEPDGAPVPGEGPAHVLAGRGIAAVGMGQLLGESREGGNDGRGYLNLANLRSYRDTWRQGMIEGRLLFDALTDVAIAPDVVAACADLSLPDGSDFHVLNIDELGMMGQSAGGHLTMELTALDERVQAAVPTGAGGYWTLVMTLSPRQGVPPEVTAVALGTDVTPDALHPGMALLQHAWEAADPLVYAPRMSAAPLPGRAPVDVYLPMGLDDGYFPEPIFDAMALAADLDRAGPALRDETDARLELGGRQIGLGYPVQENRDGWTGAAVWWPPDGLADSHGVFAQYEGIKHQYGCFFRTRFDTGRATLVEPGAELDPCAE